MNTEVQDIVDAGYHFEVTRYRWVVCLLLGLNIMGRAIANVGFASIAKILIEIYGINTIHTTLTVLPFNFMVLFFILPYNYICQKYGFRIPTYVAVIAAVIGGWVRIGINSSFWFVILGQAIIAIGNPLTLVAPAKIAAIWFGDDQRALATMVCSLMNPIGAVIGFILPFMFVGDDDAIDTEASRNKVRTYIIVQNVILMATSIPIFFFIKNKPEVAPSISALKTLHEKSEGTWINIKKLINNKDYMLLLAAFAGVFSIYVCFGAVMAPLNAMFGFKPSSNQFFGASYIVFGVVGSFVHATLLDKYKTYKKQMYFISIANILALALMTSTIHLANVPLSVAIVALFGAAQLPIIGVGYQFATELAYPINENISVGFLQFVTCFVGIVFTFITSFLVKIDAKYWALLSFGVPSIISLVCLYFLTETLNKHRLSLLYSSSIRDSKVSDLSTED
jgi:MFS family permease